MKKNPTQRLATLVVMLLSAASAHADLAVPHTFTPGTTAKSAEINQNFSTIYSAVNALPQRTGGLSCTNKEVWNLDPKDFPNRQVVLACDGTSTMVSGGAACYDSGNWMSRLTKSYPSGNGWAATCVHYNDNSTVSNAGAHIIKVMYVRCCQ